MQEEGRLKDCVQARDGYYVGKRGERERMFVCARLSGKENGENQRAPDGMKSEGGDFSFFGDGDPLVGFTRGGEATVASWLGSGRNFEQWSAAVQGGEAIVL